MDSGTLRCEWCLPSVSDTGTSRVGVGGVELLSDTAMSRRESCLLGGREGGKDGRGGGGGREGKGKTIQ